MMMVRYFIEQCSNDIFHTPNKSGEHLLFSDDQKVGPEMMTVNIAMWEFSQNDAKRSFLTINNL
jgi:hypothetical protein